MLVRVEMRNFNACVLKFSNLGDCFLFDFMRSNPVADRRFCKFRERASKTSSLAHQSRQLRSWENWCAVYKDNMASDAESCASRGGSQLPGKSYGRLERGRLSHQCRRGDYSTLATLLYSSVHARSKSEVIGVDDQFAFRSQARISRVLSLGE